MAEITGVPSPGGGGRIPAVLRLSGLVEGRHAIFSVSDIPLIGPVQGIVSHSDHRFTGEPGHDESTPLFRFRGLRHGRPGTLGLATQCSCHSDQYREDR